MTIIEGLKWHEGTKQLFLCHLYMKFWPNGSYSPETYLPDKKSFAASALLNFTDLRWPLIKIQGPTSGQFVKPGN